jgi:hypothetical protein
MSRRRARYGTAAGFTVIEIIVALFIGAVVVLGARSLLEGLAAQTSRVTTTARDGDRDANGERLLRGLVGRLEIGTDSSRRFGGDEREVHFSSWCDVARGWQERCSVSLALEPTRAGIALVGRLSTGESIVLREAARGEGLRYLADAASGGRWFVRWGDGLTAPLAVGVLLDGDTIIVRVGERS